ncbi:hypothetical protein B0H14DRAFT_2655929 [Mycena olivaceomarginata]|nr:hypothetical protein B0H14DRAFT_2655929 [Mycena olivaceomarginata]
MLNQYVTRGLLIFKNDTDWNLLPVIILAHPLLICRSPLRLAILAAQAIMVIRLWAICELLVVFFLANTDFDADNNTRKMPCFLILVYALEVAAVVACSILAVGATQGTSQPAPLGCGLDAQLPILKQYASGTWIAPVCFELIVLILTVVKLFPPLPPRFRVLGKMNVNVMKGLSIATRVRNPTLDMLARDSLNYFIFTFIFTLANPVIYETSFAAHYQSILLELGTQLPQVSRMINIRFHPTPTVQDGPGDSINRVSSDVVFAENCTYEEGQSGGRVSEVRRMSVSQPFRDGNFKERENQMDEFEMINTP